MRVLIALVLFSLGAVAQVSVYGTLGAANSGYWGNSQVSYGVGSSVKMGRVSIGVETWRADVSRQRSLWLNTDRRAEALVGLVSYRIWRGFHAEGGLGVQRLTDRAYGPLIEGSSHYQKGIVAVGGYYQTGRRVFARAGYRRSVLRNDYDTDQVYTAVGISF